MTREITVQKSTSYYRQEGDRFVYVGELGRGQHIRLSDEPVEGTMNRGTPVTMVPLLDEHEDKPKDARKLRFIKE
jgi:hypothetical protein